MQLPTFKNIKDFAYFKFLDVIGVIDTYRKYSESYQTLMVQPYYWLIKQLRPDTTLIDLGTNIGDTAIYFAMSDKVKKVYAYEPIPQTYRVAKENIAKAPEEISKKIILLNAAVTGQEISIKIKSTLLGSVSSTFDNDISSDSGIIVKRAYTCFNSKRQEQCSDKMRHRG